MAPRKAVGRVVFIYSNIYMVLRVERVESFIAADVSVFEMERAYHLDDYVDVTFDEGFVPSYIRNAKYVALALKWIMTPKRYTLVGSVNNIVDKGQDEKVYFATLQSGTPSHLSQFCSFSSRQFPQASSLKIRSSVAMIAVCNAATAKGESVSAVTSCWIVRSIAPSVGSLKDITLQYIRRVGPDEAVVTIDNETTLSTTTAAQPARGVGRILVIVNNDQDSYMIVHVPQKLIFAPVSSWESNRMYQLDDYVQIIYAPGEPSDIVRDCNHYARSIEFIKRPERRQFRARITTIYPDGIRAQAQIMGLEIFPRSVNIPASAMRPKTATLKNLTIGTEVKVLAILPAKEAINSEQELLWTARICVDSHENIDDVPPLTTTYEKPGSSRPRAAESDWDERPRAAWGTANIPSRHATPGSGDPRETVPFANDAHNIPYDSPPQEDAWNEADRKLRALAHYLLQKNNVRSTSSCFIDPTDVRYEVAMMANGSRHRLMNDNVSDGMIVVKASVDRPLGVYAVGERVLIKLRVSCVSPVESESGDSIAWGSVQLSCDRQRVDGKNKNGVEKRRPSRTSLAAGTHAVWAGRPTVLFCDLRLAPGEWRDFECEALLPPASIRPPPSHRGLLVKYSYRVTVAVQRVGRPVCLAHLPIRLLTGISVASPDTSAPTTQPNVLNPFLRAHLAAQPQTPDEEDVTDDNSMMPCSSQQHFALTNRSGKMSVLSLNKKVFRLGEDVILSFTFPPDSMTAPLYYTAWLEMEETLDDSTDQSPNRADRNGSSSSGAAQASPSPTSAVVSLSSERRVVLAAENDVCQLRVPTHGTPTFRSDLVNVSWRLCVEMCTTKRADVEDWVTESERVALAQAMAVGLAPLRVDVESLLFRTPLLVLPCSPTMLALCQPSSTTPAVVRLTL